MLCAIMSKTLIKFMRFGMPAALLVICGTLLIGCSARVNRFVEFPVNSSVLLVRAVKVPAGTYDIGSDEPGCYPRERFSTDGFYIWPVEVPRGWWQRFMPANDYDAEGMNMSVANVSLDEAIAFCDWLSNQVGVRVRLPTRQEWEVAAMAGTAGVTYPWGWSEPDGRAVFDVERAAEVASYAPNPWGLYDMAGNVAEWVQADDAAADALVMGGSWAERDPRYLRISHILRMRRDYRNADVGFRIVIESGKAAP